MANQRSPKRNKLVGAYVTPEAKQKAIAKAKARGLTLSDYIRQLLAIADETKKEK